MSEYIISIRDEADPDGWHRLTKPAEPLVRCRDCRYYVEDPQPIDPGWPMMCNESGRDMVPPYGFCAWAERKVD